MSECFLPLTLISYFNHTNIIKHCNRDPNWQNEFINNWNNLITDKNSIVFHLGDFAFYPCPDIVKSLCGKIILVLGNHDSKAIKDKKYYSCFHKVIDYAELSFKDSSKEINDFFCLSHYPMLRWNKSHYNSMMLHGHSHSNVNHLNVGLKRLDVGYDSKMMLYNQSIDKGRFMAHYGLPNEPWNYQGIINYFTDNYTSPTPHHEGD